MALFILSVAYLLVPPAFVGGLAAAIARWRGKRAAKAFWIAFLIFVGLEIIGFGLCIAAFSSG